MARRRFRRSAKANKADRAERKQNRRERAEKISTAAPNPLTNFMLTDLVIRAGSFVMRDTIEKRMMRGRYGRDRAHEVVRKQSLSRHAISMGLATLASRSLPGALIIGGGALAKTLYDRRKDRRKQQRSKASATFEQAQSDD